MGTLNPPSGRGIKKAQGYREISKGKDGTSTRAFVWGKIVSNQNGNATKHLQIAERIQQALMVLLEAVDYALDTRSQRWEFAIGLQSLQKLGLSRNDLRWLIKKGLVESARELKPRNGGLREFRTTRSVEFGKRTCFVLTDRGIVYAQSIRDRSGGKVLPAEKTCDQPTSGQHPKWNAELRELRIDGTLIRRFKWQAVNQETVLSAFEEDGWPAVIDDPLPPKPEQDSKRRLHDTIKALNRYQQVIRFRGNGNGEGICWELAHGDFR